MFDRLRKALQDLEQLSSLRHLMLEKLSPVDKYCALTTYQRFTGDYEQWRVKRIRKVLELLGPNWDWKGKRVLELGCGYGDMGAFFADAGADVTCAEGRAENIAVAKLRFRHLPTIRFVQRDLETNFADLGHFDVIVHFGLLYHIKNVDQNVGLCAQMADRVFLETEVLDSQDDRKAVVMKEDRRSYDTGLVGEFTMISPFYIKRLFEESGMTAKIHSDRALNSGPHVYDWEHKNDGTWSKHRRRFLFATRHPQDFQAV
jgi:SAM-dependent methyltransferase